MNAAQFKAKWGRFTGKESAAYQDHFGDLCRLLGLPSPVEADPTGDAEFCFQKRVLKDAELFVVTDPKGRGTLEPAEHGFADVWKKDCFAWEYKGKRKNLDDAYQQLLRYREALLNPPILVVCDFDRYIIRTNFNGAVQRTYEFVNADIDRPENLELLRTIFTAPDALRPARTTRQVTEELAGQIAEVARLLQARECVELSDARTRRELHVAEKQNLRIAQFLNRLTFCFFAEDVGLLPKGVFTELLKGGRADPHLFAESLEDLFRTMATGGVFGPYRLKRFNGHLFDEATVFELRPEEIAALAAAAEADWQAIEPSVFGTLFERALDDSRRAQRGAHYTSPDDIRTLIEPVLMAPLRRDWTALKRELLQAYRRGAAEPAEVRRIEAMLALLRGAVVLDPACGSGNFLYVALQSLLGLEKEVIAFAAQLGLTYAPEVGVNQLRAIEIDPYAFELAQVSVQIGLIQWMRDNGFAMDREPVLSVLDGFVNGDALVKDVFHRSRRLKDAQADEHASALSAKGFAEREWPACDAIVGNPPFLGGKLLRRQLGDDYVTGLFRVFEGRVPAEADLCCYWFEKARAHIAAGCCRRAGLLATQGIRGGANRAVLAAIKEGGGIFFAESDRPWVLDGANVHVSMVGFDDGSETQRTLDGRKVDAINANLTATADVVRAQPLRANLRIAFMGTTKGGAFDIDAGQALDFLHAPNPHGRPNSDVVVPWVNGLDVTRRPRDMWIVDFGVGRTEAEAAQYEAPFEYLREHVKAKRETSRSTIAEWWLHERRREEMRQALAPLPRFLATITVSKHRLFVWMTAPTQPDHQLFAFARCDDAFFGVLHSRVHEVWALRMGTQLETRPRYTPTSCFETFPFPEPNVAQAAAVAAAAKALNELRERWLNPPEWTQTEVLEFPGTVGGPWDRYIAKPEPEPMHAGAAATVRYPRLVPHDAACAAQLKRRTLTNLYNDRPGWLDLAHRELDAAVAAAYGWPADLPEEQILERLLRLNLAHTEADRQAGVTARRPTRSKRDDELI